MDNIPDLVEGTCIVCGDNGIFEYRHDKMCVACSIATCNMFLQPDPTLPPHQERQDDKMQARANRLVEVMNWLEVWDCVRGMIEYGYVTPEFAGKPSLKNLISIALTLDGMKVLGRS